MKKSNGMVPGEFICDDADIVLYEGREVIEIIVSHTGDRPIQVGSHFHFFEVNKALSFDRRRAFGFRLAIAPGTAVRFEPGQKMEVKLVKLGGERIVFGLNNLVDGPLDLEGARGKAVEKASREGFQGIS